MDTITHTPPAIVLVPGHWLGAWAWDAVAADLRGRGHQVTAVTLPGLDPDDPDRASTTVAQQAHALGSGVDTAAADGSTVVLVAHSGAGYPTSLLLDQDPTEVARVIYLDSGPSADGSAIDASVPPETDKVPLPPFEQLPASLDGLSDADLKRFREQAVPEPGSVMRETVRLNNDFRRDIPSTIIACSYPTEVMMQMAHEGHPMMPKLPPCATSNSSTCRPGTGPCGAAPPTSPQRSPTRPATDPNSFLSSSRSRHQRTPPAARSWPMSDR